MDMPEDAERPLPEKTTILRADKVTSVRVASPSSCLHNQRFTNRLPNRTAFKSERAAMFAECRRHQLKVAEQIPDPDACTGRHIQKSEENARSSETLWKHCSITAPCDVVNGQ